MTTLLIYDQLASDLAPDTDIVDDDDDEGPETALYFDAEEGTFRDADGEEIEFEMAPESQSEDLDDDEENDGEEEQEGEGQGSRTPQPAPPQQQQQRAHTITSKQTSQHGHHQSKIGAYQLVRTHVD